MLLLTRSDILKNIHPCCGADLGLSFMSNNWIGSVLRINRQNFCIGLAIKIGRGAAAAVENVGFIIESHLNMLTLLSHTHHKAKLPPVRPRMSFDFEIGDKLKRRFLTTLDIIIYEV